MRVITGSARGRRLKELEGMETRPTTDRVKEGLFNILQFDIEGRRVLDLFAGTGQLGIECLSRGAASAVFVDGKTYCGVTNVGVKPTVGSDHALSETWMPDFTGGDLYGRTLRLELLSFVRDEKKFPDLDALKAEISLNEKTARTLFEAFEKK